MSSGLSGATASYPDGSPESFLRSFVPISAKHLVLQSEYPSFCKLLDPALPAEKNCRLLYFFRLPETVVKFDAKFTGYSSISETERLAAICSVSNTVLGKYTTSIWLHLTPGFPKK